MVEFLRAGPACLVVFQRMADSAFGKAVGLPGSVIQWQQGLRPAPVEIGDEARQRTLGARGVKVGLVNSAGEGLRLPGRQCRDDTAIMMWRREKNRRVYRPKPIPRPRGGRRYSCWAIRGLISRLWCDETMGKRTCPSRRRGLLIIVGLIGLVFSLVFLPASTEGQVLRTPEEESLLRFRRV